MVELASSYRFTLPGGTTRALMDFLDGFSLIFAVQLAALGGAGYLVQKRAAADPR